MFTGVRVWLTLVTLLPISAGQPVPLPELGTQVLSCHEGRKTGQVPSSSAASSHQASDEDTLRGPPLKKVVTFDLSDLEDGSSDSSDSCPLLRRELVAGRTGMSTGIRDAAPPHSLAREGPPCHAGLEQVVST